MLLAFISFRGANTQTFPPTLLMNIISLKDQKEPCYTGETWANQQCHDPQRGPVSVV